MPQTTDADDLDEILCVLIVYENGERVWQPLRDYLSNPPRGTWIFRESIRTVPK